MRKIDAHHHFWKYSIAEYGWIDDEMAAIRRDFLPADLAAATKAAGVDAVISVQARQTEEETQWLLGLAGGTPLIAGVVGWVPLVAPDVAERLARHAAHAKLRGVRHVLQGEPDPEYMLGAEFNRGLEEVGRLGLSYDILVFERQLPQTLRLADRHPGLRFIVDHIAKPRIAEGQREPWARKLRELARRPNVWCKLSGVVTEAGYKTWTEDSIRFYLETALEAFGPRRLMFSSDWPVCLVACDYARWVEIAARTVSKLSSEEQALFWHGNAAEAYQLKT